MAGNVKASELKNIVSLFKQINESLKEGEKLTAKNSKAFDEMGKSLKDTGEEIGEINKGLDKFVKNAKKLKDATAIEPKGIKAARQEVEELTKAMQDLQKTDPTNKKAFDALDRRLKQTQNNVKAMADVMNKSMSSRMGDTISDMKDGVGQLGGMWKSLSGSPRDMHKQATMAGDFAERMKLSSTIVGKMPGLMGMAGKAAGGLAASVGGISKLLLGWPGLVLMGLKAVVDIGMKIDSFVKDANKRFAAIRGPEIMTADVGKQMRDFNLAITDIGSNLRDGLKSDEVYAFAAAIGTAGKRLTTLNNQFTDYRFAVHIAAKASKVFGMDIQRTGDIMGRFSSDYGMNLDDIDKAFVQVAFDAQKSGMSTDRFWDAVTNASASLSFYGIFVRGASKAISDLTKSQVAGADKAGTAVTDMMQSFKDGSLSANMALNVFAKNGGAEMKKMYDGIARQYNKQAEEAAKKIVILQERAASGEDVGADLEKIMNEQAAFQEKAQRANDAANKGSVAMAQNVGMLADKAPQVLMSMLKGITGQSLTAARSGEMLAVILEGSKSMTSISEEQKKYLISIAVQQGMLLRNAMGSSEESLRNGRGLLTQLQQMGKEAQEGITDSKDRLDSVREALDSVGSKIDPDEEKAVANSLMLIKGMTQQQADVLARGASTSEQALTELKKMVAESAAGTLNSANTANAINKVIDSTDAGKEMFMKGAENTDAAAGEQQKAYDDTFVQLRNHTLSLKDMTDIAKDGAKAQLYYLDGILSGINNLVLGNKEVQKAKNKEDAKRSKVSKEEKSAATTEFNSALASYMDLNTGNKLQSSTYQKGFLSQTPEAQISKTKQLKEDTAKKVGRETSVYTMLRGIKSLDQAKKLKEKKDSGLNKDQLAALDNLVMTTEAQGGDFEKVSGKQLKDLKTQLDNDKKKLSALIIMETNLPKIYTATDQMASLMGATLSEEDKASLKSNIQAEYGGQKVPFEDLAKKYSASAITSLGMKPDSKGMVNIPVESKAGITMPEIVTDPGLVMVHANESIHPAQFKEASATSGGGGGGSNNITITVNATEKDLGEKIANAVRGALYNSNIAN